MLQQIKALDVINNNGVNGGVGRRWNFVSNPFPSYIKEILLQELHNFMDVNSAVIDGSFLGVYGWNGSRLHIYNNYHAAFSIAPGQGFFVAAASTQIQRLILQLLCVPPQELEILF